ncbi:hypothetical protein A2Z33_01255 [Candidatus Gottesmanbacteria bacterium RBG_16_52_11]|uniref:Uncharacterized protein n=1 Tax=Candidatus Gottesmanbacteria bacterium RBG_16_52_11 TaxID=1798374 RepID=A0A1F5YNT1_9BACT|nr:MAG: hypothetical protein A2Z33_01255 [Candidatus Gottesmanbacteria bacterium RBG_16_52_11]
MTMEFIPRLTGRVRRFYRRKTRKIELSKRQVFVLTTGILTCLLVLTQLVPAELRLQMVGLLALLCYALAALSLREDLNGIEWLTLLTLPTMFTAGVSLFYFLLPERWLTRIPVAALYALGIYALLLTENIYNVAVNRTIALLRAAHTIGFLLTLVTFFLLTQTLFALRLNPFLNAAVIMVLAWLLYSQALWSILLTAQLGSIVRRVSIILSIGIGELAMLISFIPATSTAASLFLTTWFYITAGISQQYLLERMYKKTIAEFAVVFAIVFIFFLIITDWRGM